MFEKMPDCAPTFEQREFLSWYELNAYFCPEREAPVSPCKLSFLASLTIQQHRLHYILPPNRLQNALY